MPLNHSRHRFPCFFPEGQKSVITDTFAKKQQKFPENEKERAIRYKADHKTRVEKEEQYEESQINDRVSGKGNGPRHKR